jgi:hypothetical protein
MIQSELSILGLQTAARIHLRLSKKSEKSALCWAVSTSRVFDY